MDLSPERDKRNSRFHELDIQSRLPRSSGGGGRPVKAASEREARRARRKEPQRSNHRGELGDRRRIDKCVGGSATASRLISPATVRRVGPDTGAVRQAGAIGGCVRRVGREWMDGWKATQTVTTETGFSVIINVAPAFQERRSWDRVHGTMHRPPSRRPTGTT